MKKLFIISILFLITFTLYATHNRAGEITYQHVSGNTYKITLITYTYTPSAANESRDSLTMIWGDGTSARIPRTAIQYLPDDIQKNTYIGYHTFPGAGVYQMMMSDPNRNEGIENIPESVTVVFTIKTTLKIDPDIGANSTPVMLNPPVDKAALYQLFIHNPNAFDPDGDSISYKLSICLGNGGLPIPGYIYPEADNALYVDAVTGDFIWDTPMGIGEYNVAMEIEEWRNGIKIGSIIRDMQIEVEETDNNPPIIEDLPDLCVTAGDTISFTVTATDPDLDEVTLTASGGPFQFVNSPAVFFSNTFTWNTICEHVRKQPYNILFRAEDQNPEVGLTDYENVMIEVVAPSPQNLSALPSSTSITLSWDIYNCQNASGFKIYRKKGSYPFTPGECETGIPSNADYLLIGTLNNASSVSFTDNNFGFGLPQGYLYCYRIIAFFEDGAESYVSNEVCTELIRDTPVLTETSVNSTDTENGSIHLTWMKPPDFDTITYPGPYKYVVKSRTGQVWENFSNPVDIFGINDTTYIDTLINSVDHAKSYNITLFNQNGSDWEPIGGSALGSSLFIEGIPSNKRITVQINDSTPWTNTQYIIYRKSSDELCTPDTFPFDSITTVSKLFYTDNGLINDVNYKYLVKSVGAYDLDYIPKPLFNYSQEICVSPHDTTPPCPVSLSLESDCDLLQNYLNWSVNSECAPDIDNFLIFWSDSYQGTLQLIDTVEDNQIRTYIHQPALSLGGCYVVSGQDSAGNFIKPENLVRVCIDECNYYDLPNVFTPNNDGINDIFKPYPYKFVEKIDLVIYNRWGNPVFKTDNPDINWDGADFQTGKPVSDGVYYYVCDVFERRLSGIEVRNLAGLIRIISNAGNKTDE